MKRKAAAAAIGLPSGLDGARMWLDSPWETRDAIYDDLRKRLETLRRRDSGAYGVKRDDHAALEGLLGLLDALSAGEVKVVRA